MTHVTILLANSALTARRKAARNAAVMAHAEQARELSNRIRERWTARANAGDQEAVVVLLAQGW